MNSPQAVTMSGIEGMSVYLTPSEAGVISRAFVRASRLRDWHVEGLSHLYFRLN